MRVAACLYVKNEERDIAEWLSYYFTLGVDTIFVYENGSDDATPGVLKAASRVFDVRVIDYPLVHRRAHWIAYEDCLERAGSEFDWIGFFDADEFLTPHLTDSVKTLLAGHDGAGALAINWAIFGSNGVSDYPAGLVIESFTRRAPDNITGNRHIKSIVRPDCVAQLRSSHDFVLKDGAAYQRPGRAALPPEAWAHKGKLAIDADFSVCQLNHYFVRSRAHWEAKVRRGYHDMRPRMEEEFTLYDRNEIEDLSAIRFASRVREHMGRYL